METRFMVAVLCGTFVGGYVVGSECAFKWCGRKIYKALNALPEDLKEAVWAEIDKKKA